MWKLTREEQLVLIFLIAAFTIGIGVKLLLNPFSAPALSVSSRTIKVKVSGAVKLPGWYALPEGSLLIDAIKIAGGILPEAELEKLNLALFLKEEEEVWIPGGKININTASLKQLTYLPGIGPELAKRIIEYREDGLRFKSVLELKEVKGIGEIKFQQIKEIITIGQN